MTYPTENLCRALDVPVEYRGDDSNVVTIAFALFNQWTEINDAYEGRFLERVGTSAFDGAFTGGARSPRVLYEHGKDPSIGNKPLGTPLEYRPSRTEALVDVDLFDADYVNQLRPAMKAKQLGASFRFSVEGETWNQPTRSASHNPDRLPERTLDKVTLYEFGPVTFPAYAGAGMRATTDEWHERLLNDPQFCARFVDMVGARAAAKALASVSAYGDMDADQTVLVESGHVDSTHTIARARIAAFLLH